VGKDKWEREVWYREKGNGNKEERVAEKKLKY
jgi:hypothetical protein